MRFLNPILVMAAAALAFAHAESIVHAFLVAIGVQAWAAARAGALDAEHQASGGDTPPHRGGLAFVGLLASALAWAGFAWVAVRTLAS